MHRSIEYSHYGLDCVEVLNLQRQAYLEIGSSHMSSS